MKFVKNWFPAVQKLGRSLMLPIAVLPVAGLLLRLGQPDLLDLPYVAAAGSAVFSNLGLLFAIGVAVGLARGNNGAAGLAAVVAYLVTTEGAKVLIGVPPEQLEGVAEEFAGLVSASYKDAAIAKLSVPAGLISGIMAGLFYNRFCDIRLPDYLAFFAGRRFVPIVSGFAALLVAAVFGLGWPVLEAGMNALSEGVVNAGGVGLFVYGLLNRLLIITGLHHILNNIAWFIVGDFEGVTGDLLRFFAGDPSAGAFMTGFFPIMMFGLPAACLAMYRCADSARKKAVGGLLFSMALTSFLTGITEPIEFTFMFLAPVLFGIHAVLTGLSMALMDLLNVRHGFGFSAGLFDYILNYNKAQDAWMILPVGAAYFAVYYFLFRWFILRFNVPTPGREAEDEAADGEVAVTPGNQDEEARALITALGGSENLAEIDACTTRLRLQVLSQDPVDEAALKRLGAAGVLRPTQQTVQVIMGLRADEIASTMRRVAGGLAPANEPAAVVPSKEEIPQATDEVVDTAAVEELLQILGGAANVKSVEGQGTRLLLALEDDSQLSEQSVFDAGYRGIARLDGGRIQLPGHEDQHAVAEALKARI